MTNQSKKRIDEQIINNLEKKIQNDPLYLDFLGEDSKSLTHGYHTYPAMMIPKLAREFIELTVKYNPKIKNLYDPFMGSGTSLVEGITHNLSVYGNDINPLSILMSKVKTTPLSPELLRDNSEQLRKSINFMYTMYIRGSYKISNIPTFDRVDFWFKPDVIQLLQLIKNCILEWEDNSIRLFFLAAFSETVRYVSNTRNNEFKLYRIAPDKLNSWDPNVIDHFYNYLNRNIEGNSALYYKLENQNNVSPSVNITQGSSAEIPSSYKNMMDLVVTSPPYGDSKTTVAYGQFSRLSLQWLDLKISEETTINQLDNIMLGGRVNKDLNVRNALDRLNSPTLEETYMQVDRVDTKRSKEVLQFYIDLDKTIEETTNVMKTGSYQYWVVANRTVKLINIPTDLIISELFKKYKVNHLHSFYRNIPNKRMPSKNSPTNKIGNHAMTMTSEIILMLKKED